MIGAGSIQPLLFNGCQHRATSWSASIADVQRPIGSDYAGSVPETFVQQGDAVLQHIGLIAIDL